MNPVQVSVIIVSWNVIQKVLMCLETLYASSARLAIDVTVVDNASSDGTVEAVQRAFPQTQVIANSANAGFACACNQGVRWTNGRFVLLLNPDCYLVPDACAAMAGYLADHPEVAAVGPRLQRPDGTTDWHNPRRLPTLWSDFCNWTGLAEAFPTSCAVAGHRMPNWDRSQTGEVTCLSGACLMVSRCALEQVGLLDEDFFLFGEDAISACVSGRQVGSSTTWEVQVLSTKAEPALVKFKMA